MKHFFSISFILVTTVLVSQEIFYQGVYNGGISFVGVSSSGFSGSENLPLVIEPGSTIQKIFLVTISQNHSIHGGINDTYVQLNGDNFQLNFNDGLVISASWPLNPANIYGHSVHINDITESLNLSPGQISISMPIQTNIPTNCPGCVYSCPGVIILYDNPSLSKICVVLSANNKPQAYSTQFNFSNLPPANQSQDILLSIHSDRLGSTIQDGYNFKLNGNIIGSVNQPDASTINSGAVGCFNFQNGGATGLTDDNSNSVLSGSDAIALINTYINGSGNNISVDMEYVEPIQNNMFHNNLIGIYLAYSTPCDTFSVTTTPDTTICYGETLQLSATGGNANASNTGYLWSPAHDLSCTDCPNPVFSGDSSRLYTVQIWNNDSCSVVRPIKINVRPQSAFAGATVTPSECGTNNGAVHLQAAPSNGNATSFTMNGGGPQTDNSFLNLGAGTYTFSYTDVYGCASEDTVITVGEVNTTAANFLLSPTSGANPLTVTVSNTSQNATDFEWYWNSNFEGNSLSQVLADSSGTHTITLIAWQYDPSCADTLTQTFVVYDSLVFSVPNVFTPNNDGINDFFTIAFNQDVQVSYSILNRWGETIQAEQLKATVNIPLVLWDGLDATEGVYFLELEVVDGLGVVHSHEGFVHLER